MAYRDGGVDIDNPLGSQYIIVTVTMLTCAYDAVLTHVV